MRASAHCRSLVNASSSIAGFGDDTIKSYTWNFGDGDSSTEEVTSHIYTQEGSFEIALTVTNSDDLSSYDDADSQHDAAD